MQMTTFEGIVEHGRIRLKTNINLPEKTKVYVIIPDLEIPNVARVYSPRLAHPEQAIDFEKEIIEDIPDASV